MFLFSRGENNSSSINTMELLLLRIGRTSVRLIIYNFNKLINSLTGIDFNINNVTTFFHENRRTGARKVNLTLEIESPSIRQLRMDLGYKPYNKAFNMHVTLLEQEI